MESIEYEEIRWNPYKKYIDIGTIRFAAAQFISKFDELCLLFRKNIHFNKDRIAPLEIRYHSKSLARIIIYATLF